MKNSNLNGYFSKDYGLIEMNYDEQKINGGWFQVALLALEIYAGACVVAYAAGYAAGTFIANHVKDPKKI